MKFEKNQIIWIIVALLALAIAGGLIYFDWQLSGSGMGDFLITDAGDTELEIGRASCRERV